MKQNKIDKIDHQKKINEIDIYKMLAVLVLKGCRLEIFYYIIIYFISQ